MQITQLTKWGNSQGIRLNKEILRELKLDLEEVENQKIKFEIKIKSGQLILNPIKEMTKLEKLFEDFHDDSEEFKVSIDWGDPVGKEIW